ncbi:unnamed protein product [Bursaphelenchus xylophilus]|uniref:(pine wood nematode) hypothetical protein n=1 Tax=Bursaphelenchus xylophilus TaxID=6326 RepID=A0A1I7RZ23_BURXY|nr:unnamed protein product [Bursaphelenchus xylophilus]CAG9106933.1 unnamed protein product [Bursaphelenchus xylophilus]
MSTIEERRESDVSEPGSADATDTTNTDNDIEVIDLIEDSDDDEGTKKNMDQFGDRSRESDKGSTKSDNEDQEQEVEVEGELEEEVEEAGQETQELNGIFEGLSSDEQEEVFSSENRVSAYQNFILATFLMFTIPCGLMYASYKFLFLEHYHLPPDQAALYGGIVGIISVYVIIGIFIYIAYHEEKGIEQRIKAIKSR